jgi:tetratricopeptide (TPR) repeat protein
MKIPTPEELSANLQRAERYLAIDPVNPILLANAIDASLALGNVDAALKHAQAAIAQRPDDPFVANRYGSVLIARGQLDEAARVFEKLAAQTADPSVAFNLSLVYFRQGRYAQARSVFEPYISQEGVSPAAVTLFVRTLHHLDEIEPAVELVKQHEARCSGDADFLAAASLLYLDDDQLDAAQRFSEAALALGKRPLEALVVGGSVALAHDDTAAAKTMFNDALSVSPTDGRSWSGLGMASLLTGELSDAREQLLHAVDNLPADIGSWHALGWCQIASGELAGAGHTFRKVLALDRNVAESHGGLAVVDALLGRKSEAQAGIERALRLDPEGLSAKYAQMVLSGVNSDPEKFRKLALGIISARPGHMGALLAQAIAKRER